MTNIIKDQECLQPKKLGKHRNRKAGHGFELDMVKLFKELGYPNVVTSRSENRARDGEGIDLCNRSELENGRLPFNVQCKNSCKVINPVDIFKGRKKSVKSKLTGVNKVINVPGMPRISGVLNILIQKLTAKSKKGGNFIEQGIYVTMPLEDFVELATLKQNYDTVQRIRNTRSPFQGKIYPKTSDESFKPIENESSID